jgi:uncharacterized membrane protein YagU involved in acid resistance
MLNNKLNPMIKINYNTINPINYSESCVSEDSVSESWCNKINSFIYHLLFCIVCIIGFIVAIIIIILILYSIGVLFGIIMVVFNTMFEYTIVYLFGRALYNKNFPVCTNTQYMGGNCYTTTNTYCS